MILDIIGLVVNLVGFWYLNRVISEANSNTKESITNAELNVTQNIERSTYYIKPKQQIETRAASKETTETYKETYI